MLFSIWSNSIRAGKCKTVFGMNIKEIVPGTGGTLAHYVAVAVPLTIITIWVIVAFQSKYLYTKPPRFWVRLGWPKILLERLFGAKKVKKGGKDTTKTRDDDDHTSRTGFWKRGRVSANQGSPTRHLPYFSFTDRYATS